MSSADEFQQKLEIARNALKLLRSGPISSFEERELRLKEDLLYSLEGEEKVDAWRQEPRVFVSFAGKSGPALFKKMLRVLKEDGRFQVEHAMADQGEPTVLGTIRSKMKSCRLF